RILLMHLHQDVDVRSVEILLGSEIGSAKLLAGGVCTQRFDQVEGLFNILASLRQVAACSFHSRSSQQGGSLPAAVTYHLERRYSPVELLQRLLCFSQRTTDQANPMERGSFCVAVAGRLTDWQGLVVFFQRLPRLP